MAQSLGIDDYVFARDYKASARLELQHYLWLDQARYLVHPSIQLRVSNPRVADVGTGTGTWILDVARSLPPTATLNGFDIDLSQCPSKSWLPGNVSMLILDALDELPLDLIAQFDLVHVRLFMFVVSDPVPLLANVIKLLKPGGWLQWEEYDNETAHTIKAHPNTPSHAFDELFNSFNILNSKTNPLWVKTLHEEFKYHGLLDVSVSRISTAPEKLASMTDLFIMAWDELITRVKDESKAQALRNLFPGAVAETRQGLAYDMDRVTIVGRKSAS